MVVVQNYAVWIEYWEPDEPHGHLLLIKNDDEILGMPAIFGDIEGFADELAGLFLDCRNQSHGKGIKHSHDTALRAYDAAIFQLRNTDYQEKWNEMLRKERAYRLWGGQVPKIVLQPQADNPKDWEALITDPEGNPSLHRLRKGILDDIMLPPQEYGAMPNKYGLGWSLKKRKN